MTLFYVVVLALQFIIRLRFPKHVSYLSIIRNFLLSVFSQRKHAFYHQNTLLDAFRTNSRNAIGRSSSMGILLLANQDLTAMLYLPPKHASRTNSRNIIGRDPSMVIPLLPNQDLIPILVILRWGSPFSCSARSPRVFALKLNQFVMQFHSNYTTVIVKVIVSLPF